MYFPKPHHFLFVGLVALSALGCSAFRVHDANGVEYDGVPFFAKRGYLQQTTVRSRSWTEVSLTVLELDPDGKEKDKRTTSFAIPTARWNTTPSWPSSVKFGEVSR